MAQKGEWEVVANAVAALESTRPGAGLEWLQECAIIEKANELDCSECGHRMGYHDGIRRCHVGALPAGDRRFACNCDNGNSR